MEKLLKILSEIKPGVDFKNETNFIERGLLTSFDVLRLVMEISNEFDIEISPLYIVPENFKSVESIMALIQKIESEE